MTAHGKTLIAMPKWPTWCSVMSLSQSMTAATLSLLVVLTAVWLPAGAAQGVGRTQSADPAAERCAALKSAGGLPIPRL